MHPQVSRAHQYLGLPLRVTEEYASAIDSLSRYFELDEGDNALRKGRAEWPLQKAWTLIDGGRYQVAVTLVSDALMQFPRSAALYGACAAATSHPGQLDEAIADYSLALELDPGNTATSKARGTRQLKLLMKDQRTEYVSTSS